MPSQILDSFFSPHRIKEYSYLRQIVKSYGYEQVPNEWLQVAFTNGQWKLINEDECKCVNKKKFKQMVKHRKIVML